MSEIPDGRAIDDAKAAWALEELSRSERRVTDAIQLGLTGGSRPLFSRHFYLFGIARRALAQSAAFRQMVESRNSLVAAALVRLQLDTVLRLYALFWVANPDAFADLVFSGEQVDRLKAADGQRMTDKYLRKRLEPRNPWMASVYEQSWGFVHFSHRHMHAALEPKENGEPNEVMMMIGPSDRDKTVGYYGELLRAFLHLNDMLVPAIEDALLRIDGKQLEA